MAMFPPMTSSSQGQPSIGVEAVELLTAEWKVPCLNAPPPPRPASPYNLLKDPTCTKIITHLLIYTIYPQEYFKEGYIMLTSMNEVASRQISERSLRNLCKILDQKNFKDDYIGKGASEMFQCDLQNIKLNFLDPSFTKTLGPKVSVNYL